MTICGLTVLSFLVWSSGHAQRYLGHRATGSGGELMAEQAAYDVTYYDLNLNVVPDEKTISGWCEVTANITSPIEWFVLDLHERLQVSQVELRTPDGDWQPVHQERRGNQIWTHLRPSRQPGDMLAVKVSYAGNPKEAPAPPWVGGFTWAQTADGHPWIATSVQNDGADLWFPCKDHPSDEPDSVGIHITIPRPLTLVSNGVLREVSDNKDGTRTYHWFTRQPINNYNIALNIAPYEVLRTDYRSTAGETIPVSFYFLPEHRAPAETVFPQFTAHLRFYEETLGPYPFRSEKYSVVETPHLGMEHQTVIAYGRIKNNEFGFDELHHHELGHEWWGNLVTALDWRDFWLHEGFCSYMQALYAESLHGEQAYHRYIARVRAGIRNLAAVAPREPTTTVERYFAPPEYIASDGDIYTKGSTVLHTLRYLIGKEALLTALRRFAYPTAEHRTATDGSQCRFATTDDFLHLLEQVTGRELDWFFEVYLRQPVPPKLIAEQIDRSVSLRWELPNDLPFPMPVEVKIGEEVQRVEMQNGRGEIKLSDAEQRWQVDPQNWILKMSSDK